MCQECEEDGSWSGLDKPAVTAPHLPSGLFHSCVPISSGFALGGASNTCCAHTRSWGAPHGARSWVNPRAPVPKGYIHPGTARSHPPQGCQPVFFWLQQQFWVFAVLYLWLTLIQRDLLGVWARTWRCCASSRGTRAGKTPTSPLVICDFFDFIEAFGQEKPKSQHGPKAGVRGCSHVPPHHKNLARPQGAGLLPAPWLRWGFGLHQLLILLPTSALFLQ